MANLFEIIEIEKSDLEIEVTLSNEKNLFIERAKFERWLKYSDRLDTEINYSNSFGDHIQTCSTLSLEEYWELSEKEIFKDLYDFIIHNANTFQSLKTIFQPAKILNHA